MLKMIEAGLVDPNPHQPRTEFDAAALQELSESIKKHGLLQPVVVTPADNGRYWLIAGERRLRAIRDILGWAEIAAVVKDDEVEASEMAEWAYIENSDREGLTPLEEGVYFQQLMERQGYGITRLSNRLGRSHVYIKSRIQMLELAPEVQAMIVQKVVPTDLKVVTALQRLNDESQAKLCEALAKTASGGGITTVGRQAVVRGVEKVLVRMGKVAAAEEAPKRPKKRAPDFPPSLTLVPNSDKLPEFVRSSLAEQCGVCPWLADNNETTCLNCPLTAAARRMVSQYRPQAVA